MFGFCTLGSLLRAISEISKEGKPTKTLEDEAESIVAESKYAELYDMFITAARYGATTILKDKMVISSELEKELKEKDIHFNNEEYPKHTEFSW